MMPCILTINGGSSSIKFALFADGAEPMRIVSGRIEGIGLPSGRLTVSGTQSGDNMDQAIGDLSHRHAVEILVAWMRKHLERRELIAVGHRIVSGGTEYCQAQDITPAMLDTLRAGSAYDPEHLPQELLLIDAVQRNFPALRHIACFDTAFHRDMPSVARRVPIPRRYQEQGIQRYGFHGLSCTYVMKAIASHQGNTGRVLIAHLGNGASVTAVRDGRSIDTSMGFSPCSGLVMGSRSGDLDPGLAWYLEQKSQLTSGQFHHMVNHESGLLGVSGISSDMRELLSRENHDAHAAEAIELFCYQVKKWICALAGVLGGIDMLVFTGGIGENLPAIRARICDGLQFVGIRLDNEKNNDNARFVSVPDATVAVTVIRTDEESVIADAVFAIAGHAHKDEFHENAG